MDNLNFGGIGKGRLAKVSVHPEKGLAYSPSNEIYEVTIYDESIHYRKG